jgi:hypothetical protein
MPPEEWAAIPDAKKQQMIPTYHQSIVHDPTMTEFVRAALLQSIHTVLTKGGNPTQALAIIAQWDDPVFKNMPAKTRKEFEKRITVKGKNGKARPMNYLVIPWERDLWTGGPGAPDWAEDHPYTEQMLKLCNEPESGCLWILVVAGGAASVFQLGDKPIFVPSAPEAGGEAGGTEVVIETQDAADVPIDPFDTPTTESWAPQQRSDEPGLAHKHNDTSEPIE